MKPLKICLLLATSLLFIQGVEATQMDYSIGLNRTNLTSAGVPMDGQFRFELGVFKSGFVPSLTNIAQWSTNWTSAQGKAYAVNISNASRGGVAGTFTVTNNVAPFTAGTRYYFWGFRGSEVSGEWILMTRTNWNWPVASEAGSSIFSSGSAAAVVGAVDTNVNAGNGSTPFHLQSAAISNALPPPMGWSNWSTVNLGSVPPPGVSSDLNTNGITDALEYAIHSGESSNPAAWLQLGQTNGNRHLEVRIPRRRDRPASYVVEVSTNLLDWTNGPSFTEIVEDSAAALVVRDKTAIGDGGDRRFLRVRTVVTP